MQTHAVVQLFHGREGYEGEVFDQDELFLHNCMKPNGDSHVFVNVWWGDRIDYANVRPGQRLQVRVGGFYNPGRHLKLDLDHLYEHMEVDAGQLYTANITQGTIAYQFTTRTFVRAILQYVDNEFNVALYEDDDRDSEQRDLFAQLLFSYKLNPQTVFFLGYTESSFANQEYDLTTADRTVFAKVGYAFRF
jgi:hypothetical protein